MKRAIGVMLSAILLLSLCACGKKETATTWQEQYDLGVRYLSEGNYEEAIIAFTTAIEIDPKQADAYIGRGDAYIGSGESEENLAAALADYQSVLELDDTGADAYLGMADVYIRQGDYEKAQDILERGYEKTGDQSISDKLEEIKAGTFTDSSGNTRRMSGYDSSGKLMWYHTYTYNSKGWYNSVTSYDAVGNQTGHVDMQYSADGKQLVDFWCYYGDGAVGKMECQYDENGNILYEAHYFPNGEKFDYFSYEYDEKGNPTREISYDADGILTGSSVYSYDLNGKEIRKDSFSADGTLCSYETTTYHDNGCRDVYSWYNADGVLEWYWVSQYDEEWNYIGESCYDAIGNLTSSTVEE